MQRIDDVKLFEAFTELVGTPCAHQDCTKVGAWHVKGVTGKLCDAHLREYAEALLAESREAEYDRNHPFGTGA